MRPARRRAPRSTDEGGLTVESACAPTGNPASSKTTKTGSSSPADSNRPARDVGGSGPWPNLARPRSRWSLHAARPRPAPVRLQQPSSVERRGGDVLDGPGEGRGYPPGREDGRHPAAPFPDGFRCDRAIRFQRDRPSVTLSDRRVLARPYGLCGGTSRDDQPRRHDCRRAVCSFAPGSLLFRRGP